VADGKERSLQILDRFRLVWDGADVDVPRHSATLVAHLAVLDRPVHRSTIAGSLSPTLSESRALAGLRSALYRIGVPAVRADGDIIALARDVRVDLRDAIGLARALTRGGLPDRIEPVVEVLCQELLPDDDSVWIEAERQRFRHLRLCALDALAGRLTAAGRHSEAVEAAQVAIAVEPASEQAEATLVRALVAEGNTALAMREWHAFRARLWRELRVRPAHEFDEVCAEDPHGHPSVMQTRPAGHESATRR
jgi:DNA-binding SARP family transcriptional activator